MPAAPWRAGGVGGRSAPLPLTPFQDEVATLIAANRSEDSYLAGGAALHLQPESKRYSNDLDYFHDSVERVASAFDADRGILVANGIGVDVVMNQPGFIRAIVRRTPDATKVEWAHDSAWRFVPTESNDRVGRRLHPIDVAVNKVLALAGRNEARDFIDTLHIINELLPLGPLCWAAAGKDPGFTPSSLLEHLRRRGRFRQEDVARLHLAEPVDLVSLKATWLEALDEAERFIASRPTDEIGCLYYSPSSARFVDPTTHPDALVHHGRPGGVVPRLTP